MTSRERITKIFAKEPADRVGFWTGNPHGDTIPIYLSALGLRTVEELYTYLNDDCRWIPADAGYRHPEGRPYFDPICGIDGDFNCTTMVARPGRFAECESVAEVDAHEWPNPDYLDFTGVIDEIKKYPDKAVFTGMWTCFFHFVADYFGMENYFVKMYTHPEVVDAVTDHVVGFYAEANERFFKQLGDNADVFFLGNDFGTQLSLLLSPELFKRFVLPGFKKNIEIGKKYGKKVLLHSCGAISEVIPLLIDAGIDGLHPLQAKASGMDAEKLAREFGKDIAFVGGVDTQHLLIYATPSEIKDEVRRLKDLLGPNYIVSPSHEAILPNVPLENVIAMSEAAVE
ncbi:MAG: uroporphyrinogen decarboxylase family protein [Armatimonadota bacterium]